MCTGAISAAAQNPEPKLPATGTAQAPESTLTDKKGPSDTPGRNVEPAIEGYCPTSYLMLGKPVKGDPAYQSEHLGDLYYFSSAEAKEAFDADPWKYAPQFAGLCTTALGGTYGHRNPADPEVFDVVDGKVYLFVSDRAKRAYDRGPEIYINNATIRFNVPALDGYCPASYQVNGQALRGRKDLSQQYRGRIYHFVNRAAHEAFQSDPARFVPRYDGFCAKGMSRGKRFPADPQYFFVTNNTTYLFFDARAKLDFQIDTQQKIEQADANWERSEKERLEELRKILRSGNP
jgi:YHS domain-containing protein